MFVRPVNDALNYLDKITCPVGIERMYHDFDHSDNHDGSYLKDGVMYYVSYDFDPESDETNILTYQFKDIVSRDMLNKSSVLIQEVDNKVVDLSSSSEKTSYINGILDTLLHYLKRVRENPDCFYCMNDDICGLLLQIALSFKDLYISLPSLSSHPIFDSVTEGGAAVSNGGILGYKGLLSSIPILYNKLKGLDFFSHESDQIDNFRAILTADSIEEITKPLQINCSSKKAGYIISKMRHELFRNFKSEFIERIFKTKYNANFTKGNVYTSKNKCINEPELDEFRDEVDDFFEGFL